MFEKTLCLMQIDFPVRTVPSQEAEDKYSRTEDKDRLSGSVVRREKNKCVRRRQEEVVVQRGVGVAH